MPDPNVAYIGIDVAIAKSKRLPVSICTWVEGRLVPIPLRELNLLPPRGRGNPAVLDAEGVRDYALEAAAYVRKVCSKLRLTPGRIAIDAPSEPCAANQRRRDAEIAMDRAGISCFATPTTAKFEEILGKVRVHLARGGLVSRLPHSQQLWMINGFSLFEELRSVAPCIEVFPQATIRALGAGAIHKSKAGAVEAQLAQVAKHTGWPSETNEGPALRDIAFAPAHDCLDAYLSAWVAALDESQRIAYGRPPDDVIWVPRIGAGVYQAPNIRQEPKPRSRPAQPRKISSTGGNTLDCPACGRHEFRRWPFGWDAHAAHKCAGLVATEPGARKAEFKNRFGHLFPGRRKRS